MIEHAVVLCRGEYITIQDLPSHLHTATERSALDPYHLEEGYEIKLRIFEKEMIEEALRRSSWNQSAAARLLNMTERHLRSRLEKLDIKRPSK